MKPLTLSLSADCFSAAALVLALFAVSCEQGDSSAGASSGAGNTIHFDEVDLVGTWELQLIWENPLLPPKDPAFPLFAEDDTLQGEVLLETWGIANGDDFMNNVLAFDIDLRPDGDFTMWVHYEVPESDQFGSFLFSGGMTDDKIAIQGQGNDHGANGDPNGIIGVWNEDFHFSLVRL